VLDAIGDLYLPRASPLIGKYTAVQIRDTGLNNALSPSDTGQREVNSRSGIGGKAWGKEVGTSRRMEGMGIEGDWLTMDGSIEKGESPLGMWGTSWGRRERKGGERDEGDEA
jgi:hypothetical protein